MRDRIRRYNLKLLLVLASLAIPALAYSEGPAVNIDSASQTPIPAYLVSGQQTPIPVQLNTQLTPVPVIPFAGTPQPAGATPLPLEVTPIAQAIMQPTALPTLFPVTPNALTNSAALKAVRINNQYNTDIQCSYGAAAATPLPFTVPAGTQHYENFAANGAKLSSGVSCIHPSSTPASGTLQVWGY